MKKIKPIQWVLIAIAVYFLFIHENETFTWENDFVDDSNGDVNGNPMPRMMADPSINEGRNGGITPNVGKKLCSGRKCKAVRRRGFLGLWRRVAKDYCSYTGQEATPCMCLQAPCS